jgi:nicotinate-nucleotide adenylyltransferase
MTRVGILGGSFDPPHVAHAAMANAARERLGLSKVMLAPATSPPHKRAERLSPYEHRLAMTEIAAATMEGVEASRLEEDRSGPSYTVDLLRSVARSTDGDLYFIMGSDSLSELETWRQPRELLELCALVVFPRSGSPVRLGVDGGASLVVIEEPVIDVSSTQIRERVRKGLAVEDLVAPGVLEYIRRHALYTNP